MKKTALERAVAQLDSEIAVLEAAKKRLMDQRAAEKSRKPAKITKPAKLAEVS